MNDISITLEFTPNPNTLKFVVDRPLLDKGTANFPTRERVQDSPLASVIFQVPGISALLIGRDFITITKSTDGDWDQIAEGVPNAIREHVKSGQAVLSPSWFEKYATASTQDASEIERKIREILDEEIRPAVAMDGGDIVFEKYENGIAYLHMQGACSSCPSSVATLKMGVENRLRESIPELQEVVQV